MPRKLKKEKSPPEQFWNELVSVYFNFCKEKFNEIPSFDGSSPKDFKSIIISLKERATKLNIEWNLETATMRLYNFLSFAYKDQWLRDNFLLSNINRQKDKIFFNIRKVVSTLNG